ncbi:MAG: PAS domain-containing sensor histidine kinase [Opitutaceae bacterium]|nr:PAS domain-containing sensor histidine kinase [Opitutaceae bacterium]
MSTSFPVTTGAPTALPDRMLVSAFLEYVPDHIHFKDRSSRFLALSRSLVRYLGGRTAADIIGRTAADFLPAEQARALHDEEQRILCTGQPVHGRLEREIRRDGRVCWFIAHRLPLRNESGEIIGTFAARKDVTRNKEMESDLEQARRDLLDASRSAGMAEIANGILHNVGNVLNSLNVSAAMIGSGLRQSKAGSLIRAGELLRAHETDLAAFVTEDPKGRRIPEFIRELARHAVETHQRLRQEVAVLQKNIDHIKEIVAMQQAYATTAGVVEPLSATALFEDALQMNADALQRRAVEVRRDYAAVPEVRAEKSKVLQILVNLICNAEHACQEQGAPGRWVSLRLETTPERDRVRFIVEDNGVGIPAANLTRIFALGFTTRPEGHGFGLHSAANAAREMKGTLTARSAGPGLGATFTLDLPAAA